MKHNILTAKIHSKGYKLEEFLVIVNRGRDWFYKHSNGGSQHALLTLAIEGLTDANS